MSRMRDVFLRPKSEPMAAATKCAYSSGEREVVDYLNIEVKESRADQALFRGIGQSKYSSGMPPAIYTTAINAARTYPIVYAVVTAISEAVSGLGVKVYEVTGGQRVEQLDHPFYQLFKAPNPHQGSMEFLDELEQYLDVCGNAFIAKERVSGGYELYNLNPQYMAVIPDPKTRVKGYRYYVNGNVVQYKPEEIIHIKLNDLSDAYYGMPPLTAASEVLTFEKNRLKFANQFFVNSAIPVGVLETDNTIGNETVQKKLRNEWNAVYQGVSNSHKIAILQGGLKYKPLTSPIKDLDFPGLKKLSRDDILAIYKVPASILGDQEGTGAKEGKDAIVSFWRQCIIPRVRRIESGLNRGLSVEMFGKGQYSFEFDLSGIAALQDDKESTARYIKDLVGSSVLTPNQGRALIGQPRSDDPFADKLMVSASQFGNALIPVDQLNMQGQGSTEPKPTPVPAKPKAKPKPKE